MSKKPDDDYYDVPGPGKADLEAGKVTKIDRYDWSRNSKPEPNFIPKKK